MTPERWYIAFWLLAGIVALGPIYYLLWRFVRVAETIQLILSVKNG